MIKANAVTKVVDTSEGSLQILRPISFEVKRYQLPLLARRARAVNLGLLGELTKLQKGKFS